MGEERNGKVRGRGKKKGEGGGGAVKETEEKKTCGSWPNSVDWK